MEHHGKVGIARSSVCDAEGRSSGRFQRLENDKWDAIVSAGLNIIYLEIQMLLTARRGP